MPRPLISVVLPTRSRLSLLPRAVESVFRQTWADFDLLVIDDGPLDGREKTRVALQRWLGDTRLRYLPHDVHLNAACARNFGLSHARGDWITFLDDDDVFVPNKIEAQWQCAKETSAPLVLCGARYNLNGRVRIRQVNCTSFRGESLLLDAQVGTPFIFHRRNDEVRFDEGLSAGEDTDYFLKLVASFAVTEVPNVPKPLVEVYPQIQGQRVNAQAQRSLHRAICLRHARRFGRKAARHCVARSEVLRCRWSAASMRALWRASVRLFLVGGRSECRLIVNTWLLRVPWVRRFLVT